MEYLNTAFVFFSVLHPLLTSVAAQDPPFPAILVPEGLDYEGCYGADGTNPLGYNASSSVSNVTLEQCSSTCADHGYSYSGTIYGSLCFCDAQINGDTVDNALCNNRCVGNSSEVCGGQDYMSVLWNHDVKSEAGDEVQDYNIQGCFPHVEAQDWALFSRQDLDPENMTRDICNQQCLDGGYGVAGTMQGSQCWCGNAGNSPIPKRIADDQCSIACTGVGYVNCGGLDNMYVLSTAIDPKEQLPPNLPTVTSTTTVSGTSSPTAASTNDAGVTTASRMAWIASAILFVASMV